MHPRPLLVAAGAGLTVGLVVAVLVIEALNVEFSAIVGLPAGVIAGLVVAAVVVGRYEAAGTPQRAAADAVAAFGYTLLGGAAVQYVGLFGLREVLTLQRLAGVAAVAAVGVFVASWVQG